jgi:hypothetical protein
MIARRDGATLGHGSGYSKVQGGGWGEVCDAWKKRYCVLVACDHACHDFFVMKHWILRHEKTAALEPLRIISLGGRELLQLKVRRNASMTK